MTFEETAGTAEAIETSTGDSPDVGQTMGDTIGSLFPDTPAPDRPVPAPQAHRARITGVTAETSKEGETRFLKVSYQSLETAADDSLMIFPPQAYVDNPLIDASALSTETPVNPNTGRNQMSDRQKYANSVRNSGKVAKEGSIIGHSTLPSDGTALGDGTIETIARFAKEQGHTVSTATTPRTFDQLAAYLNQLVTGTEVVALLRPQGGDGEFADRLRTQRFVSQEFAENVLKTYNPQNGRGYRRLWMNE